MEKLFEQCRSLGLEIINIEQAKEMIEEIKNDKNKIWIKKNIPNTKVLKIKNRTKKRKSKIELRFKQKEAKFYILDEAHSCLSKF